MFIKWRKKMYQKPKGTRDILPDVSPKWQKMESVARDLAKQFGYEEIRTPIFEDTSLFLRSVGESSDIVSKEMYTFEDKGGRSITLRPEGTAGVVRAFVEYGMFNDPLPQKMFYIGSNFRYEKPQAGRYREHAQFGAECFGVDTPWGELESIDLAMTYLKNLGINKVELHINSIGCPDCRAKYNQALKEFAEKHIDKLCGDCKRRAKVNPLRMLDCKVPECQEIYKNAPKLADYLCEDCKKHFAEVQKLLKENGINFVVDPQLVRGFDYYTKTVFEFTCLDIDGTGKSLAVGGGGRYNNLVEEIGGKPTSCVGFGMGLDRLIMLLSEQKKESVDAFLMNVGNVGIDKIYPIAHQIREQGLKVECNLNNRSFKAQFKFADKIGAKYVCILGDEDLKNGEWTVKNLATGVEKRVKEQNLAITLLNK